MSEDPDKTNIDDDFKELNRLRAKFMPWQREIMIVGMILLIALVIFLGVAYGGMKVCADLDGILDDKFRCHPNYTTSQGDNLNAVGQRFVIPDIKDMIGVEIDG